LHADGEDGSTWFGDDSDSAHFATANGNTQIDTQESRFGGASGLFDGDSDYLSIPDSDDWNFGAGDFTIDFWVRFNNLPAEGGYMYVFNQRSADNRNRQRLIVENNGEDGYSIFYSVVDNYDWTIWIDYWGAELLTDTWYHIALARSGDSAYMFLNGQIDWQPDNVSGLSVPDIEAPFEIGRWSGGGYYFDGSIDEFRVSKGVARWASNFTPPNAPHSAEIGDAQYYVSNVDYSPSGQITRIEYGNGNVTEYTYDPLNLRLTHLVTTSPTAGTIQDLSYQYDSSGNILQITDSINTATQAFQYDELNRLVVATGAYGTKYYDYDEIGNMTLKDGVIYSYGAGSAGPHALTSGSDGSIFTYDENGNMVSMTDSQLKTTNYIYDAENRLKSVKINNQTKASFVYDGDGGRTKKTLYKYSGGGGCFLAGTPILMADGTNKPIEKVKVGDLVLSFDEENNLLVADSVKQNFIHKTDEYFILNGSLRVTGEHPFYSNGQWIKVNELKIGDSLKDRDGSLKTITDMQKVKADVLVYNLEVNPYHTYFASGFLVHNKMPMRIFNDTGSGDDYSLLQNEKPSQLRYVFEFLSSLLEPAVAEAATVTEIPTIFVGSLYEKTSGSPTRHIFLGSQRICSVVHGPSSIDYLYYHTDHLGSTNVITNDAGSQIALYEYKPYGEFSVKEETSADPTEYFFTGKKLDDETGLYFYGARYYNPAVGRFITPDPTIQHPGDPQDLNRYSYCRNNPVNLVDPTGLGWFKKFIDKWAGLFGLAGGLIKGIVTGDWSTLRNMAIAGTMGFIFGGPVGAAVGVVSAGFMDTPSGQQFSRFMSEDVCDDAFGMRPRAAYIVGNMMAYAIVSSTVYIAITPASYNGPDYTKTGNQKGDVSKYGIEDGDAQPGGSTANYIAREIKDGTDLAGKTQWYQQGRLSSDIAWKGTPVVDKVFETLNVRHAAATVNVGGKLVDSAKNVSLKNLLKGQVYASPWTATSHQAFFRTLIQSGMSGAQALGAATSQAGWSFYLTSSIYGVEGHSGAVGIINAEVNRR
jgi:RHS repeat-associated protein